MKDTFNFLLEFSEKFYITGIITSKFKNKAFVGINIHKFHRSPKLYLDHKMFRKKVRRVSESASGFFGVLKVTKNWFSMWFSNIAIQSIIAQMGKLRF